MEILIRLVRKLTNTLATCRYFWLGWINHNKETDRWAAMDQQEETCEVPWDVLCLCEAFTMHPYHCHRSLSLLWQKNLSAANPSATFCVPVTSVLLSQGWQEKETTFNCFSIRRPVVSFLKLYESLYKYSASHTLIYSCRPVAMSTLTSTFRFNLCYYSISNQENSHLMTSSLWFSMKSVTVSSLLSTQSHYKW